MNKWMLTGNKIAIIFEVAAVMYLIIAIPVILTLFILILI